MIEATYKANGIVTATIDGKVYDMPADLIAARDGELPRRVSDWVQAGGKISAYQPPKPTIDDVRAEAQRRIIVLTGTSDLLACMIKQSNANMRANEFNDKRLRGGVLTAAEEAEAAALRGLADKIKAIRVASNAMEANPPADYKADSRWPA